VDLGEASVPDKARSCRRFGIVASCVLADFTLKVARKEKNSIFMLMMVL